jgi:hypothetical protein
MLGSSSLEAFKNPNQTMCLTLPPLWQSFATKDIVGRQYYVCIGVFERFIQPGHIIRNCRSIPRCRCSRGVSDVQTLYSHYHENKYRNELLMSLVE